MVLRNLIKSVPIFVNGDKFFVDVEYVYYEKEVVKHELDDPSTWEIIGEEIEITSITQESIPLASKNKKLNDGDLEDIEMQLMEYISSLVPDFD